MEVTKENLKEFLDSLENLPSSRKLVFDYECPNCEKPQISKLNVFSLKSRLSKRTSSYFLYCTKCYLSQMNKRPEVVKSSLVKRKQTNLERYGASEFFETKEFKDKKKETSLERYGKENPMQSETLKSKVSQTNLERYGVENPMQLDSVKGRRVETSLERYGKEFYSQTEVGKEALRQCWTEEKRQEFSQRQKDWYNNLPEEEKEAILEKINQYWKNLTEEKKQAISEKHRKFWQSLPDEKRLSISEKHKDWYNSLTDLQKLELRRKSNKHNQLIASDGERFDSKWELKYYEFCLEKGYSIIREPVALEYYYEGVKHNYFPDFSVNGTLVEIKGNHLKDSEGRWINLYDKSLNGLYEAKRQCALSNQVTLLYEEDLRKLGIKL